MAETRICADCGAGVPVDAPGGFCPACLLSAGAEGKTVGADAGLTGANSPGGSTRLFGDYELLEEIARGGMGIVYKARQISLDRIVAVKLILSGAGASPESIHRFRIEATAAANLQHPHIVTVHEVGAHQGENFLVMDFVDGPNFSRLVGRQPLPAQRAARYLKAIAEAIHYAHERGILHRDLKPSNILLDSAGDRPRVTDFGLAKRLEGETDLTLSGQVLGSPNYMSPEQAVGKRGAVGKRSDIYSLGAILYHLLTGRAPFQGDTITDVLHQVVNNDPAAPRSLNPNVPPDLETICLKCLEKEPSSRYQTALELAEELGRFLRDEPIHARPTGPLPRAVKWMRRKPALATALTTAVALVVALGVIVWQNAANRGLRANNPKSLAVVLRAIEPNAVPLAKEWSRDLNHLFVQLSGLTTLERSQVLKWEGSNDSAEKIGQALGASAVLLGELRQVDDRVQLEMELFSFPDRARLWSHGFTQKEADWDIVRSQIAREVIGKLRVSATEADQSLLRRPLSKNQEAFAEYRAGRRYGDVLDPTSLTKAVQRFEAAVRHDPHFAQAHAGLAEAHMNLGYAYHDPLPPLTKARAATDAALKIDSSLPEAKIMDGLLKYFLDWDWPGAQQALDEALRLDVSVLEANACYLHMQYIYGPGTEALAKVKRAAALHPSSRFIQSELGCAAYYGSLFDEAEAYSRESLRNEPDNPLIYYLLARTLAQNDKENEALDKLAEAKSKPGGEWCGLDAELAYIHARKGQTNQAQQIIAALKAREKTEYIDPYLYAMIYAGLGDAQQMFAYLNQACDKRSGYVSSLPCEPKFAPYRSDSRYGQILARMKLPLAHQPGATEARKY